MVVDSSISLYKKEGITYQELSPCNFSVEAIEKIALKLRNHLEYSPTIKMNPLIERLGGNIKIIPECWMEGQKVGSICVHGKKDFDILLSKYTSPLRDRFTICHELGHYILHSNFGQKPIIAMNYGSGQIENEANQFAAGFLMPRQEILQKAEELKGNKYLLADYFNVSFSTLEVRLNYIKNSPYELL